MQRFVGTAVSLFLVLWLPGCSQRVSVPKYVVPPAHAFGQFVVGRFKTEITPPPGYPMGGHSIAGKVARGYWTHLYARAFYFQDAGGNNLALVSCDLFAIPAGLRAEAAKLAAQQGVPLLPAALILAATHTHHGPGNYMTSELYNGFSSPLPGFDSTLFSFLAARIAEAIKKAWEDASQSSSSPHSLVLRVGAAPNLQRNRAIDAFFKNPDWAEVIEQARAQGMRCPDGTDENCSRYLAADPTLTVLEVLRKTGGTQARIALLVFFAVHPTAMTHENPLWSSDLVGRAMASLEREAPGSETLVAGYFNGAEGDVSPRWDRQDRGDVEEMGDKLADAVRRVLMAAGQTAGNTDISVASGNFSIDQNGNNSAGFKAKPEFGVASLGGAEDGRTALYYYGWHGGVVSQKDRGAQGNKQPALELPNVRLLRILRLTPHVAPQRNFPDYFPVSIARIGDVLTIGSIPAEMTTTMGRRIRKSLGEIERPRQFVLVGLANEYFSYVTTPEEYGAQDYEGASTIFGVEEGTEIETLLQRLAAHSSVGSKVASDADRTISSMTFKVGQKPITPFGPELQPEPRIPLDEDLQMLAPASLTWQSSRAPRCEWDEDRGMDWRTQDRGVAIYRKGDGDRWAPLLVGTVPEDDSGADLLTVLEDGRRPARRWAAIWLPPSASDRNADYLFRVKTGLDGNVHCTQPFRLGTLSVVEPAPPFRADQDCPAGVK